MPVAKRDPDFLKTLERMHHDSKILFEEGEYYNSCYLSGYVLECALKFLLCRYGRKATGENYTWRDVKQHQHRLIEQLTKRLAGFYPNIMNTTEQGEFMIGYYQQRQKN